jgi:hypothetical protein
MTNTQMLALLAAIWLSPHIPAPVGIFLWFIYSVMWCFS